MSNESKRDSTTASMDVSGPAPSARQKLQLLRSDLRRLSLRTGVRAGAEPETFCGKVHNQSL